MTPSLTPPSLRDAIALVTLAVEGDVDEGAKLRDVVLAESAAVDTVNAVVALGSALALHVARLGTMVHNCADAAEAALLVGELDPADLRTAALESMQAIGEAIARMLED